MDSPVVNYYAQRKHLISLGAALPIILTFPNRIMMYLSGLRMRTDEIMNLPLAAWLTVTEDGTKFGLEPATRVVVKASELQAYLRWWENNRTGYYRPEHWSHHNQQTDNPSSDAGEVEAL